MRIGIDLGETIVTKKVTNDGSSVFFPDAVRVIRKLVRVQGNEVFIISKVNRLQKVQSLAWLEQSDFFAITGIMKKNLFYCAEREDKAPIARSLGITHHIDDRPEVMAHFDDNVHKYLFRPEPAEVMAYFNQLKNTHIVNSWLEIEELL